MSSTAQTSEWHVPGVVTDVLLFIGTMLPEQREATIVSARLGRHEV